MVARSKNHYAKIFEETMNLWGKYGEEYRTILKEYHTLLEEKRRLNIRPLNKIKESAIREFPVISLLYFDDYRSAEEYLLSLTSLQLMEVMTDVVLYSDSKLRRDLLAHNFDYRYEIRTRNVRKSKYAMSPDACGSGRRDSHHRISQDTDR